MTHQEKAMKVFSERTNCAQAVFSGFADELGISVEQAQSVAMCFAGGMRKGEVCGAVSGAIMVLGMKYANAGEDYAASRAIAFQKASEFMDRFREANGSYICKDVLGCDISTPEGMEHARNNDYFKTICPKMVESAVKILEEMEQI